jgi:hypothetical protein
MTRLAGLYLSPRLVPALLYHALSALSTMLICSNGLQHVRTAYLFFLPVLFKTIKARENLSSRNLFVCNSLEVSNIIFFVKIRSNFL